MSVCWPIFSMSCWCFDVQHFSASFHDWSALVTHLPKHLPMLCSTSGFSVLTNTTKKYIQKSRKASLSLEQNSFTMFCVIYWGAKRFLRRKRKKSSVVISTEFCGSSARLCYKMQLTQFALCSHFFQLKVMFCLVKNTQNNDKAGIFFLQT